MRYRFLFSFILWNFLLDTYVRDFFSRIVHRGESGKKKKQLSLICSGSKIVAFDYLTSRLIAIYILGLNLYILGDLLKLSHAFIISLLIYIAISIIDVKSYNYPEAEIYFRLFLRNPISSQTYWLIIPFIFYFPLLLIIVELVIPGLIDIICNE